MSLRRTGGDSKAGANAEGLGTKQSRHHHMPETLEGTVTSVCTHAPR